jgi:hypothetical protein
MFAACGQAQTLKHHADHADHADNLRNQGGFNGRVA